MLHNEARNLLVEAYEKTHDANPVFALPTDRTVHVAWSSRRGPVSPQTCAGDRKHYNIAEGGANGRPLWSHSVQEPSFPAVPEGGVTVCRGSQQPYISA